MSIPTETCNATAITRHRGREVNNALDDLPEFGHTMACSQGVKLFFETLTPRAVLIIEKIGYEIEETSYVTNTRSRMVCAGVKKC